ncbi:FAD-binding protein [Paenibacillus marinisediminis]
MSNKWDASFDVVVVGSGSGGLTAALTAQLKGLKSLVIEKTSKYGGSSALSGGALWIPNNFYLEQAGLRDTYDKAMAYMNSTVGDRVSDARKEAYVKRGGEMLRFLYGNTTYVRFRYTPAYSDYYPEHAGGNPNGRSIEPLMVDLRKLGDDLPNMRENGLPTKGLVMNTSEFHKVNMITRTWIGKRTSIKLGMRLIGSKITGAKYATLGSALIARLRMAHLEVKGDMWLNTSFVDYVTDNGRVIGITAERNGKQVRIEAKRGVILAAGGFSHNQQMRDKYLPAPSKVEWTSSAEAQTGDVIGASVRLGAKLDLMERVWGAPSVVPPGSKPFFLVADRGIPNMMAVNGAGERFVNECVPYHEFVDTMYAKDRPDAKTSTCWIILDELAKKRYIFLGLFPGQPFPQKWLDSGFVKKAATPAELAKQMGVPADKLTATFERFNRFAKNGVDEDFHRGDSAYDRYYGDPTLKNPNLLALENGPFYAVPVVPGDIGTKGGLLTDEFARVVTDNGEVIEGLFATGNCSASVMGETYPGSGATIGPSMTFGYVAATCMAEQA